LIEVSKIVKRHGANTVLDGVSMTVTRGEVAVIVGPSGGGKSTLLRCINGLEAFQDGQIAVGNSRLTAAESATVSGAALVDLRRRIGMVFQQFNLFPHKTVLENVLLAPCVALRQPRSQAEPLARQLLERVGLSDKLHARPEQLSGGQQQRVAIARALAVRPEAILFDEPTSALDPRMAGEVLAVIADLASQGQTMIVVTHAMGFARKVGHTVHVMHAGKVAESGPPQQIYEAPTCEVTKHFLAESTAS
jgi:ABC-type polar amino acid transport system ATPase subunit